MTSADLGALIKGLAPVLKEYVATTIAGVSNRMAAMESRLASIRDGKDGERGEKGENGQDGIIGPIGPPGVNGVPGDRGERGEIGPPGETGATGSPGAIPEEWGTRLAGMEAAFATMHEKAAADEVSADEVCASLADLFTKELAVIQLPRLSKRVIRDADGRVERVVEEVV